jgi:mono/diheme cytochrome c family protein
MRRLLRPLALVAALLVAGCNEDAPASDDGANRSAASSFGMIQDRTSLSPAEALFVEKCSMCHRNMGMGTVLLARRMDPEKAPLENRADLTEEYVTQVARMGMGNMPAIPPGEVSDEQLQQIAAYLARGAGE